jgi:hypothetical protein
MQLGFIRANVFFIQEMMCFGKQWHMHGKKIGCGQHSVKVRSRHALRDCRRRDRLTVEILDRHVEAFCASSHGLTNTSETDNPEFLVVHIVAEQHLQSPRLPCTGTCKIVAFNNAAGCGHQECPCEICCCFCENPGSVRDQDPEATGRLGVDIIEAHGDVTNDADIGNGFEDFAIEDVGQLGQRPLLALQSSNEFLPRQDAVFGIRVNRGPAFQELHGFVKDGLCDKNFTEQSNLPCIRIVWLSGFIVKRVLEFACLFHEDSGHVPHTRQHICFEGES